LLHLGYGDHWGAFATRNEAQAFLPPGRRLSYDDDRLVPMNCDSFAQIHLFDWPVMFCLQQSMARGQLGTVTDFGGHVGVKFKAYGAAMAFPDDLVWQVVDVPAMCRAGRRYGPAPALRFFERLEDARACDVLICSGVLQYADLTLEQIIERLPRRPPLIILNKVALSPDNGFYTLESFGPGRMPYRVLPAWELDDVRQRQGYELQSRWDIPYRDFEVPAADGTHPVKMVGEIWRLRRPRVSRGRLPVGALPFDVVESPRGRVRMAAKA